MCEINHLISLILTVIFAIEPSLKTWSKNVFVTISSIMFSEKMGVVYRLWNAEKIFHKVIWMFAPALDGELL